MGWLHPEGNQFTRVSYHLYNHHVAFKFFREQNYYFKVGQKVQALFQSEAETVISKGVDVYFKGGQ